MRIRQGMARQIRGGWRVDDQQIKKGNMTEKPIEQMQKEIHEIVEKQAAKAEVLLGDEFADFAALMAKLSALPKPVKSLLIECLQAQVDYSTLND